MLSGQAGSTLDGEVVDCTTISFTAACDDVDADGVCDDVDDCVGEFDECGVCNGDGIADGACDCDGNIADCAGTCGGDAVVDECGECGGDGSACAETTVEILYDSDEDIYGFQFNVSGASVTGASGGAAADAGFTVSTSASVVLGFSFTGSYIPAGSLSLIHI